MNIQSYTSALGKVAKEMLPEEAAAAGVVLTAKVGLGTLLAGTAISSDNPIATSLVLGLAAVIGGGVARIGYRAHKQHKEEATLEGSEKNIKVGSSVWASMFDEVESQFSIPSALPEAATAEKPMSVNTAIKVGAGTGISAARVGMGAMFPGSDFIHGVVSSMMDVVKNVGQDAANKAIDSKAVGGRVLESMETHVVKIQEMGASLVNNPAIQQAIATMPNNIEVSSDQITNESATNQIKVPAAVQKIIDEHDNGEVQQTHIEALNAEKSGPSKGNLSPAH